MKDEISIEFGKRLKEVRKKLNNITQTEFAKQMGMAKSSLCEIESGEVKPGFDFFYKLIRLFGINPAYLMHGDPPVFLNEMQQQAKQQEGVLLKKRPIDGKLAEILWYIDNCDAMYYGMLSLFTLFKLEHDGLIKEELNKHGIKPEDSGF